MVDNVDGHVIYFYGEATRIAKLDEGKDSGIKLKFDCVKSFMNTKAFPKFCTKYGLDSKIVASLCESFATHVDLPKEKWFKYNPPIEV